MPRTYFPMPKEFGELPFPDAILDGDTLYISGRIGLETNPIRVPAKLEDEIHLLMKWLKDPLTAAGMTMDNLVSVTIYCPDLSLFGKFNEIYKTYFTPGRFPTRAFIGSGPLLFGGHFELTAIAVRAR